MAMDRRVSTEQIGAAAFVGSSPRLLTDGRRVSVRPIEPTDVVGLRAMHGRLSVTSVVRRFFTALPELGMLQATRFCEVDGRARVALVAVSAAGELVAVARYDRLPGTDDAEVAIVVQDDHQHRGLGTALLRSLTQHARERGVRRFTADVLADNGRMFAAFRDADLVGSCDYDHGVAHVVLLLPAPTWLAAPGGPEEPGPQGNAPSARDAKRVSAQRGEF
jgi:GNAT superfamily N-acetyltransferase